MGSNPTLSATSPTNVRSFNMLAWIRGQRLFVGGENLIILCAADLWAITSTGVPRQALRPRGDLFPERNATMWDRSADAWC